ncbi:transposase, partial [mine drainage metagenome]
HEFMLRREEFDARYQARSNVESVNSAIKRKLGEPLLHRDRTARFNELLAKILAYNIGVIIQQIYENGIDPGVPGLPLPKRRKGAVQGAVDASCDFIPESGTKSRVDEKGN